MCQAGERFNKEGGEAKGRGRAAIRAVTSNPTSAFRDANAAIALSGALFECRDVRMKRFVLKNLDKDRRRGRLRRKVEEGFICHEPHGFRRSMLSGQQNLSGLLSENKPGLEILESSWQNMQPDYNGGSFVAA